MTAFGFRAGTRKGDEMDDLLIDQKRAALEKLAAEIKRIVTPPPANVVQFSEAAAE